MAAPNLIPLVREALGGPGFRWLSNVSPSTQSPTLLGRSLAHWTDDQTPGKVKKAPQGMADLTDLGQEHGWALTIKRAVKQTVV